MSPGASDSLERMTPTELVGLVRRLLGEVERLRAQNEKVGAALVGLRVENQTLKDEIARLKHLPPRPPLKPSGMEKATDRPEGGAERDEDGASKRRRGPGVLRLSIDRTETLSVEAPAGSRHKGFEDIIVQDLMLKAETTRYRRERWETPEGGRLIARLRSASASSGSDASFSGPDDLRENRGASDRSGSGDLQAPSCAACDRQARQLPRRGRSGAAGGACRRALRHRRRHRRAPCL